MDFFILFSYFQFILFRITIDIHFYVHFGFNWFDATAGFSEIPVLGGFWYIDSFHLHFGEKLAWAWVFVFICYSHFIGGSL